MLHRSRSQSLTFPHVSTTWLLAKAIRQTSAREYMRTGKQPTCSCSTSRVHWDAISRAPCVMRSCSLQRTALPSEVSGFCSCSDSTGLQVITARSGFCAGDSYKSAMVSYGPVNSVLPHGPHVPAQHSRRGMSGKL